MQREQVQSLLHALWPKNQNKKQKQYCHTFNKNFKNGPHQKKKKKTYEKAQNERQVPSSSGTYQSREPNAHFFLTQETMLLLA